MFGYITPSKSTLLKQDFVLYRAFYCGICLQIGKDYGNLPRFTTSYDITFLAVLAHDFLNQPVEFSECKCIGNPIKKKLTVVSNPLLEKLCAVNTILSYHKLCDDVIDGGGINKKIARKFMQKAYRKAKLKADGADEIVSFWYENLRQMEKANESSVDKVGHAFASLLSQLCNYVVDGKGDANFLALCYNIGKFVYIADALDDIGDDAKGGNYNPFLVGCEYNGRKEFIAQNRDELKFLFACTVNRVAESFNKMKFCQSYTLLKNIIYVGLREKVNELLLSEKKLPRPEI